MQRAGSQKRRHRPRPRLATQQYSCCPEDRDQRTEDTRKRALSSPVLRPLISVLRIPSRRPGGYGEGPNTRSHPELGREIPQRQWYCVLRRGRVGRRQVFQTEPNKTTTRSKRIPLPEIRDQRTEESTP